MVSASEIFCCYPVFVMSALNRALMFFVLAAVSLPSVCQAPPADREQVDEHLLKARQYLRDHRPDLAIPELQKVVEIDPDNTDARANLGVLLFFHRDYKTAVPELRAVLKVKPDLWKIRALLGLAEANLNQADQSRADLEAAFPQLTDAKTRAQVGRVLIDIYTAEGELEKAATVVSALLAAEPTDKSLLYLSYRLYSDLAGKSMLTLTMVDPESAEVHQMMAHELERHKDDAAAIANLREAIKLDEHLPGIHSELGELLYHSQDAKLQEQAAAEFKAALALNRRDKQALLMLGQIAERRGDQKAAYDSYSEVLKLDPNDSDAYTGLGKVLVTMGRPDQAREMFEKAVQLDPGSYVAHYRLSTLYRKEGKADAAREQAALYVRYKQMKDKLKKVFQDMRVLGTGPAEDDNPPSE